MQLDLERNLGEQPIAHIMQQHGLQARDLVAAASDQITYKMISRACKGRRLTPNVQTKMRQALANASGKQYALTELFNY